MTTSPINQDKNMKNIKSDIEFDSFILQIWFLENQMILNPVKCHYMEIGVNGLYHQIILNSIEITNSNKKNH